MHLALALGLAVGLRDASRRGQAVVSKHDRRRCSRLVDGLARSASRIGGTYMGYVVLVQVTLAWCSSKSSRSGPGGSIAIARLSVIESNRRMWAPWVVITVFFVILAFTHWFLQPPRPAEMGRLFVGTLIAALLAPADGRWSRPDAAEPAAGHPEPDDLHRRLQAGPADRADLGPDARVHGDRDGPGARLRRDQPGLPSANRRRDDHDDRASSPIKAANGTDPAEANLLRDQAEQLRNRMTARVPVYGCVDLPRLAGTPHIMGIDVGQEQSSTEPRSHIEGGTPATAIWQLRGRSRPLRTPVGSKAPTDRHPDSGRAASCRPGTIEGLHNRSIRPPARDRRRRTRGQRNPTLPRPRAELAGERQPAQRRARRTPPRLMRSEGSPPMRLTPRPAEPRRPSKPTEAAACACRRPQAALAADPVEMTFNVYRTTKGRVGEPVYAQIEVDQSEHRHRRLRRTSSRSASTTPTSG